MFFIAGKSRHTPLNLEYNIYGEGKEKIIFLTGVLGSVSTWKNQINYITKHYPQYQVACFHYRGLGKSEFLPSHQGIRDYSLDLLDFINHLKWDKVHLIGTSVGSKVAYDFAIHSPHRVCSLLLSAMKPPNDNYISNTLSIKDSFLNKDLDTFQSLFFSTDFLNSITSDGITMKHKIKNSLLKQLNNDQLNRITIDEQFKSTYQFLTTSNDNFNLKKRDYPISIICGGSDIIYPINDSLQLFDFIKPESFTIFKGCGHGLPNERYNDFNIEMHKSLNLKRDSNRTEINIYKNIFNNNNEYNNNNNTINPNIITNPILNKVIKSYNSNQSIRYSIALNSLKRYIKL